MKAESNYKIADKELSEIKKQIPKLLNNIRLKLATFDEVNVALIERICRNEFETIRQQTIKAYLAIAQKTYREAYDYAATLGYKDGNYNPLWLGAITDWLLEYDEVTGYVFDNELKRKESRFVEKIISLLLNGKMHESVEMLMVYKKNSKYIADQITQYGDIIAYKSMVQAYNNAGVTTVMWLSEYDNRVCNVCLSLNGLKFPLDKAPAKPHWGCRCWLIPIKNNNRQRSR